MKAIVCTKYGSPDVLQLQEVAKPAPLDDEVLIRIYAASINSRDWHMMRANPFFIRLVPGGFLQPKNKILGADVAGQVEAVGRYVKQFNPGDEVFGYLPSATGRGTFAEYVCANENAISLKPAKLTFEQAAAVPLAAMTALQGLRDKGNLQPGRKVLINGASGGVGTFAVQIAKAFGAEVTAVCSPRNLEMVHSLGANHVIDYTREDFTQNGQRHDLILAVNGYHPISDYLHAIKPEVTCETQQEINYYWDKLVEGGEEGPCGWLKDKYSLSWQITPAILSEMLSDKDKDRTNRVMDTFLQMKKLDIAKIQKAYINDAET